MWPVAARHRALVSQSWSLRAGLSELVLSARAQEEGSAPHGATALPTLRRICEKARSRKARSPERNHALVCSSSPFHPWKTCMEA